MIKKFPFPNYVYVSSKPVKNLGDSSIDSDSFKELEEEIDKKKKKDSLKNKNKLFIPRETKKPVLQNNKKKNEIFSQKALKLTPHSSTKYTEKRTFKNSFKISEKENSLNMINKTHYQKENNRYNNCYDKVIKNNLRFLSCLKDEESDYSEGIINNEISVNFVEGFNIKSKKIKEKQVEIPLENISRINTNSEMSNDNICNLIFSKTNKISNQSLMKEKKEKNLLQKRKNDYNINKTFLDDKENYSPNKQYDKEIKIDLKEINTNNIINNIIYLNKSKSMKKSINNKYFEIKKSQNSLGSRIKNNQRNSFINFNLTKKYKIFHKFLSIGIDTSGLNTLDEEMKNFILNPKINYNFPLNNLENELE